MTTCPLWWCAAARATCRALLNGGAHPELLSAQVSALRQQASSLDEALETAAALDGRVLQMLAEGEPGHLELIRRARALQELSSQRARGLVRSFLREPDEAPPPATALCEAGNALGLVGRSAALLQVIARAQLAARSREPVLIVGESGVGKELVARAIHLLSGDPHDKFTAVNCAAIPADLMESELFGHRRGSFSGALRDHVGLVRAASGGTLFLDELTELAPAAQAKLLRVIQEQRVRGIGETQERRVAVRFVASTNRPLAECLARGLIRRDLYYRLQRVVIQVPPLRERREDVPLLVAHFIARWRGAYPWLQPARVDAEVLERLCRYSWPGNVRELENLVFAACAAGAEGLATEARLLEAESRLATTAALSPSLASLHPGPPLLLDAPPPPGPPDPPVSLREAERSAIHRALQLSEGNKSLASRLLGISRKQLYVKIRLYGLPL